MAQSIPAKDIRRDLLVCYEDTSPDIGNHIKFATLVIKARQMPDTDIVCEGNMCAVITQAMQFDLPLGD